MKLVMTVVMRDEVDLVDAHVAFHLNAGVDLVIATDHSSVDGTTDILESYARDGVVRLIREEGNLLRQGTWQTRMARLAATEHGAEWVITSDADEFWWPSKGSLKQVLGAVPAEYGVVHAFSHSFLPRAGDEWFPERMTVRLAPAAPINDPSTPYRPVAKVAFRAAPGVVVGWGNHRVSGVDFPDLRDWSSIDILHFPVRSAEQIARKYWNKARAWEKENLRGDVARARSVFAQGRPQDLFDRLVVADDIVERGLAEGVLTTDTRLRDALRALRSPTGEGFLRSKSLDGAFQAAGPDAAESTRHALYLGVLRDADLIRVQRRVDDLSLRVNAVERRRSSRFRLFRTREERSDPLPLHLR